METIVQVVTGRGRGAIAVVQVRGPGALAIVDAVFRPRRGGPLDGTAPGRLRLGRVGRGRGDEVVCVRLADEPQTVEIQCHGGPAAVETVVAAVAAAGAMRTDDPGRDDAETGDRLAAQAIADLPHAPTLRTAEILLEQSKGALRSGLEELTVAVLRGTADASDRLERMIRRASIGLRLIDGWKVVLTGRPNVGKSRLFNALAGFTRAIVDPTPGVTRDVVSVAAALEGWPVELSDTAGIRRTDDPVERIGIERSNAAREGADLVAVVLDRSEPLESADRRILAANPGALIVASKCDLPGSWDPAELGGDRSSTLQVSAQTGEGLLELIRAIAGRLVPDPPRPGDAVPFRPAHVEGLKRALAHLDGGDCDAAAAELGGIAGARRPR